MRVSVGLGAVSCRGIRSTGHLPLLFHAGAVPHTFTRATSAAGGGGGAGVAH